MDTTNSKTCPFRFDIYFMIYLQTISLMSKCYLGNQCMFADIRPAVVILYMNVESCDFSLFLNPCTSTPSYGRNANARLVLGVTIQNLLHGSGKLVKGYEVG
jgi:hypothetical protein